jgi:hypothetical protein
LHVAQASIPLQRREDFAVVGVQFHGLADPDGSIITNWQVMPNIEVIEADYATTCSAPRP